MNQLPLEIALQQKIDLKTKPLGALGVLERLAHQIGVVQRTLHPQLKNPHVLLFAADHGVAESGVSAYPQEVTYQMVYNILRGGAAVNVFCRQHGIQIRTIDAGVKHQFTGDLLPIDCKISWGTQDFSKQAAMSEDQMVACLKAGRDQVKLVAATGCNVIGFGEMGIANTSSASMIMHYMTGIALEKCVGRGTGVNDTQLAHKLDVLSTAATLHGEVTGPEVVLQKVGGFEIAQMVGAMLEACEQQMLVLVDGFIATSAYLIAHAMQPSIANYAVFCHSSHESGHALMLNYLGVKALVHLEMRVGEGTGCAMAYPILESAVRFLNEMASFDSAGIANKDV